MKLNTPRVLIPGMRVSLLSRDRNGLIANGCRAAIRVSDAAVTPGVLLKASSVRPMANAHSMADHCG